MPLLAAVKRCDYLKNIVFGFQSRILLEVAGFIYWLPLKSTVSLSGRREGDVLDWSWCPWVPISGASIFVIVSLREMDVNNGSG
jgi:hypothetical protein